MEKRKINSVNLTHKANIILTELKKQGKFNLSKYVCECLEKQFTLDIKVKYYEYILKECEREIKESKDKLLKYEEKLKELKKYEE
jgi:hypothetical protein